MGGEWYEDADGNRTYTEVASEIREIKGDIGLYEYLMECVTAAFNHRKKYEGFWETVDENYRQSRFEPKGSPREMLDQVYPGRVYRFVHTIESSVFSNNVKMFLDGYNPAIDEDTTKTMEDILNSEWSNENALTKEERKTIRNATKYGHGITMSSYEADFAKIKKERAEPQSPQDRDILAAAEGQLAGELAALPADVSPMTYELDERVRREQITSRSVSVWHFYVDPDATSLDDARFMGRVIFPSLDAVKADPNLKHTDLLEAAGKERFKQLIGKGGGRSATTSPVGRVVLFEHWHKQDDGTWTMYVFADSNAKAGILRKEEQPYWVGHPFDDLRWNEDGDGFYSQSDILSVFTEILAERLLLTKALDGYAREHEDLTLFDKALDITREKLNEIVDPAIGRWVGVSMPTGKNLQQSVFQPPKNNKSAEPLNFLAMMDRSIQQNSGVSPNQLGQALKSGTTATEANSIASYASASQAHKQAAVEAHLASVGQRRLGLMAQFYTSERVARVAGKKAAEGWAKIQWTEEMVANGFRVCVKPGSTRPVNEDLRAQADMAVLNLIGQFPALMTTINIQEIFKDLFRNIGFHEGSKIFLENDPQKIAEANALLALQDAGGGGGSAPAPAAMPSSEAGMAQVTQG